MMQRKNKQQNNPLIRPTPPTSSSTASLSASLPINTSALPVATVVRNRYGTQPFDKNWLNVDCCGLVCAAMTYFLHAFGCYVVCFVLLPSWMKYEREDGVSKLTLWGIFHSIGFCLVAALAIISHLKAMCTDPGAVPPDAQPIPDNLDAKLNDDMKPCTARNKKRLCRRCNSYKPDRAHHCSICKRCIIKMDHHCPWVNNCVGIGNHKYFLLFIFYTFFSCAYSMFLVVLRFAHCLNVFTLVAKNRCLDNPANLLSIIALTVESLLFGLFTLCMMADQWDVVMTNVTHIDRLKGDIFEESGDDHAGVNEVFGIGIGGGKGKRWANFRADWLSPFTKVCFPISLEDDIMGFCRPCVFKGGKRKEEEEDSLVDVRGSPRNIGGNEEIV